MVTSPASCSLGTITYCCCCQDPANIWTRSSCCSDPPVHQETGSAADGGGSGAPKVHSRSEMGLESLKVWKREIPVMTSPSVLRSELPESSV